jgi:hypothetical protein
VAECSIACVHCAISKLLMRRQELLPLTSADVCLIGQVIADIVASVPADIDRELWGEQARREINRMLDEAIAGTWQQDKELVRRG